MRDFPSEFLRARGPRTQKEIAKIAGIDPTYLSNIEKGHKVPEADVVVRLCAALGLTNSAPFIDWAVQSRMKAAETVAAYHALKSNIRVVSGDFTLRDVAITAIVTTRLRGGAKGSGRQHPGEVVRFDSACKVYEVDLDSSHNGRHLMVLTDPSQAVESGDYAVFSAIDGQQRFVIYWVRNGLVTLESVAPQREAPATLAADDVAALEKVTFLSADLVAALRW